MSDHPMRRATDFKNSKRLRKGIYILPSLATTFNIAFGYYALYHTFLGSLAESWHYDNAAKAIGFAILFDGLDGRIARMTNTTTDFGRELDSLADAITFGVAPSILAWVWGFRQLGQLGGHDFLDRIVQFGAIATFAFLVAGVSRLARFNIQTNPQPWNPGRPGKKYFVGMPIPAGAGVVAATVHFFGDPLTNWWMALAWGVLVLCAGLLMVSTWRFYSFKDLDFRSRRPFRLVIIIAIVIAMIWYFSHVTLFVIALVYMLSGVIMGMRYLFHGRRQQAELKEAAESK
ncbi:MAG TPA: phosphatidylcholine/phosphatidylserine synthase [Terriglobales bacterium]|nr:phosphatidylcholine/phosphatidylserine synthase [Terriglobales bacterium]